MSRARDEEAGRRDRRTRPTLERCESRISLSGFAAAVEPETFSPSGTRLVVSIKDGPTASGASGGITKLGSRRLIIQGDGAY